MAGSTRFGPGFNRRQKAVAAFRHRLNVKRVFGAIPKRVTNLLDREVHALVEVHEGIAGPQRRLDLLPGHEQPGAIRQKAQQPKGLRLDANGAAALEEAFCLEIELEGTEASVRPNPCVDPWVARLDRLLG